MPPFERGAVVSRGGRAGVVWLDNDAGLILLPIEDGAAQPHDVPLHDTLACGLALKDARIRVKRLPPQLPAGQVQIGTMPGPIMCKVVHALARFDADAATVARWTLGDQHRRRASDNRPAVR